MAKKRKVFLHVGPSGPGDIIEAALVHHRDALVELGIDAPAKSADETFLAAVEVLREHKAWGFTRKEVEGQWATLCRRAWKGSQTVVLSLPLLAAATRPEIDLLLDGLAGLQVHVVLTPRPDEDVDAMVDRWGAAVRKPERLHVVRLEDPTPKRVWKAFGKVAGFGTASLGLAAVPEPVSIRPLTSLDEARREIERLARRNQSLERWRDESDRKRKKLKKRLGSVA
ncbi:hypothetical protein [Nocardioides antri]|uniref:Uncharacterized protein n=1 Tax=Nocardioides antri TaxID=2607659 RepID=A0A5B1M4F0_9ACTN|nr:hypothetical protein [Nocardioides antri]KAA1427631.1 hypothetical protein F0U47_09295 [Nocardioides antri]